MYSKGTGIYVHIPFCKRKCSYCDFVSAGASDSIKHQYISSLLEEIEETGSYQTQESATDSVFFGGGTPSVLDEGELLRVLEKIRKCFKVSANAEITVECNPGTVSFAKLSAYKNAGINRLSMGLQSACNEELKILGRIHTFEEFKESYNDARRAGFDNINVDLMLSVPGQDLSRVTDNMKKVTELKPEHISAYSLILEENTPMYNNIDNLPKLPSEDEERNIYHKTVEFLRKAGYRQYEISNFALEQTGSDFRCVHNLGYWNRAPYYGFGISAASLIKDKNIEKRYKNTDNIEKYLNRTSVSDIREDEEILTVKDRMAEFIFLGLRLTDGINSEMFYKTFGKRIEDVFNDQIEEHLNDKTLEKTGNGYRMTPKGTDISNYILADFL